jgi:hypothetical protein
MRHVSFYANLSSLGDTAVIMNVFALPMQALPRSHPEPLPVPGLGSMSNPLTAESRPIRAQGGLKLERTFIKSFKEPVTQSRISV